MAQNVRVGTLSCGLSGGVGMIIASQKDMICTFSGGNAPPEAYVGVIRRFGVDIGATEGGRLIWAVVAPSAGIPEPGALVGDYAGPTAQATVGAGVGANVLLGGGPRSFALQPVSVEGQLGINVAAGIAELELRPAQPALPGPRRRALR